MQTREAVAFDGGWSSGSYVHTYIPHGENIARLYAKLYVSGTAATKAEREAQISRVEVKRGNRLLVDLSAAQLHMLQDLYSGKLGAVAGDDGQIVIPFQCGEYDTLGLSRRTVLELTKPGQRLDVKIHFSGTITITSGELWYETTEEPAGEVIRTLTTEPRSAWNATGTDTYQYNRLRSGVLVKAAHLYLGVTPGVVDSIRWLRNKGEWDKIALSVLTEKLAIANLTPQSNYLHWIAGAPEQSPRLAMPLSGVTELLAETVWSTAPGAGGYSFLWELLEPQADSQPAKRG